MERCKEVVHLEEEVWKAYLDSLLTRLDNEQIYFCFFDSLLSHTRDFFDFFGCCCSSSACFSLCSISHFRYLQDRLM